MFQASCHTVTQSFVNFSGWLTKIYQGEASGLDQNGNHFALVRFGGNSRTGGIAPVGNICNDTVHLRTSANRYYDFADDLFTAMVSKYINAISYND